MNWVNLWNSWKTEWHFVRIAILTVICLTFIPFSMSWIQFMALHIVIPNSIKALKGVVKKRNDTNLNEKKKLTIFFSKVRFCLLLAFWITLFCFKFLESMDTNIGKLLYKHMYACAKWTIVSWLRHQNFYRHCS